MGAQSHGFRAPEINRLRALLIKYRETFIEAWNAHFGHQG